MIVLKDFYKSLNPLAICRYQAMGMWVLWVDI